MIVTVKHIDNESITFSNDYTLTSYHDVSCCEHHELTLNDLKLEDFDGLEFDLSNDNFFNRIEDYGIELVPIKGWSVKIPGHGYNNGYYNDNLDLVIYDNTGKEFKRFDITECQVITE